MPTAVPLKFSRSGPSHRALERWVRVLKKTHDLFERYEERTGEVPWHWGERALVSFLTAAILLQDDVALQEFATLKKNPADRRRRVRGRADLWADIQGTSFSVEAKVVTASLRVRGAANTRFLEAIADAKHTTTDYADHRLALLFVAWQGTLPEDSVPEAECRDWFGEVAACARAQAASAALCAAHLTSTPDLDRGWGYGIAMALL